MQSLSNIQPSAQSAIGVKGVTAVASNEHVFDVKNIANKDILPRIEQARGTAFAMPRMQVTPAIIEKESASSHTTRKGESGKKGASEFTTDWIEHSRDYYCGYYSKQHHCGAFRSCTGKRNIFRRYYNEGKLTAEGLVKEYNKTKECPKDDSNTQITVPEMGMCNDDDGKIVNYFARLTANKNTCFQIDEINNQSYAYKQVRRMYWYSPKGVVSCFNGALHGRYLKDLSFSVLTDSWIPEKKQATEKDNLGCVNHSGYYCKEVRASKTENEDLAVYRETQKIFEPISAKLCLSEATSSFYPPVLSINDDIDCEGLNGYTQKNYLEEKNLQLIKNYCQNVKTKLSTLFNGFPRSDAIVDRYTKASWTANATVHGKQEAQIKAAHAMSLRLCQMAVERMPNLRRQDRARLVYLLENAGLGYRRSDFNILQKAGFTTNIPRSNLYCTEKSLAGRDNSVAMPIPSYYTCIYGKSQPATQSPEVNPCELNEYGKFLFDNEFAYWLENQQEFAVVWVSLGLGMAGMLSIFATAWAIAGLVYCYQGSEYSNLINTDAAAANIEEEINRTRAAEQEVNMHVAESELVPRMLAVSISPVVNAVGGSIPAVGYTSPALEEKRNDEQARTQAAPSQERLAELESELRQRFIQRSERVPYDFYVNWKPTPSYDELDEISRRILEPVRGEEAATEDSDALIALINQGKIIQERITELVEIAGLTNKILDGLTGHQVMKRLYDLELESAVCDEKIRDLKKALESQNDAETKRALKKHQDRREKLLTKANQLKVSLPNTQEDGFYTKNMSYHYDMVHCQAEMNAIYNEEQKATRLRPLNEGLEQIKQKMLLLEDKAKALKASETGVNLGVRKALMLLAHQQAMLAKAWQDIFKRKQQIVSQIDMRPNAELEAQRNLQLELTGLATVEYVSPEERMRIIEAKEFAMVLRSQALQGAISKHEQEQKARQEQADALEMQALTALLSIDEKKLTITEPAVKPVTKRKKKQKNVELDYNALLTSLPERMRTPFINKVSAYFDDKPLLSDKVRGEFVQALASYVNASLNHYLKANEMQESQQLAENEKTAVALAALKKAIAILQQKDCVASELSKLAEHFRNILKQEKMLAAKSTTNSTVAQEIEMQPIESLEESEPLISSISSQQGEPYLGIELGPLVKQYTMRDTSTRRLKAIAKALPVKMRKDFVTQMTKILANFPELTMERMESFANSFINYILQTQKIAQEQQRLVKLEEVLNILLMPVTVEENNVDPAFLSEAEKQSLASQARAESIALLENVMPEVQVAVEAGLIKALQLGFAKDAYNVLTEADEKDTQRGVAHAFGSWLPDMLAQARYGHDLDVNLDGKLVLLVNKMLGALNSAWQGRLRAKLIDALTKALKAIPNLATLMQTSEGSYHRADIVNRLTLIIADEFSQHARLDMPKAKKVGEDLYSEQEQGIFKEVTEIATNIAETAAKHTAFAQTQQEAKLYSALSANESKKNIKAVLQQKRAEALHTLRFETGKAGAREKKVDIALQAHREKFRHRKMQLDALQSTMGIRFAETLPPLSIVNTEDQQNIVKDMREKAKVALPADAQDIQAEIDLCIPLFRA